MTKIKTVFYVVGGIGETGEFGTVGFDSPSGGCPYFSTGIPDMTRNLEVASSNWIKDAKSTYVGIKNPKIFRIILEEVE